MLPRWFRRLFPLLAIILQLTFFGIFLKACGSGSNDPVSISPQDQPQSIDAINTPTLSGQDGLFTLTQDLSGLLAGQVRLDIHSSDPLPQFLNLQGSKFVRLPVEIVPGFSSYTSDFESIFTNLSSVDSISLPGITQAEIRTEILTSNHLASDSATSLIYQNNLSTVTFIDFILVFSLTQLPESARTPANIVSVANNIFPSGNVTTASLNPVPSTINTNFISPATPGPDFRDAVIVFAATQLPQASRTTANLAAVANSIFPPGNFSASEITTIPGVVTTPALSVNDVSVNENADTASFTVSLSGTSAQNVSFTFATSNGTATAGSDYTATNVNRTINAGSTSTTITVPILEDQQDEPNETFNVTLSNPSNATIADGTGIGTIVDNDNPPTLSVNDISVNENAGGANFTVSLSGSSSQNISFTIATSNGTATAGSDYTATNVNRTINAGSTSTTITVPILEDQQDEPNETFNVTLSNPSNATIADGTGIGTIIDNDETPVNQTTLSIPQTINGSLQSGDTVEIFPNDPAFSRFVDRYTLINPPVGSGISLNVSVQDNAFSPVITVREIPGNELVVFSPFDNPTSNANVNVFIKPNTTYQVEITSTFFSTSPRTGAYILQSAVQPSESGGFQIELLYLDSPDGPVPQNVRDLVRQAANRWEQVISRDVPQATISLNPGQCNIPSSGAPITNRTVDDLLILVRLNSGIGAAGTGGPCVSRSFNSSTPTIVGQVNLNPTSSLQDSGLEQLIRHEMGHALGVGASSAWDEDIINSGSQNPRLNSPNAVSQYQIVGGTQSSIPVQIGVEAHWRGRGEPESLGDELMIPSFIVGVDTGPISRMTLGFLQDMGYTVNLNAADPYTVPSSGGRFVQPQITGQLQNLIDLREDVVLPDNFPALNEPQLYLLER